jgi:hypothetical protein
MANMGGISLDTFRGDMARGAVAVSLNGSPRNPILREFLADQWEIEARPGVEHIVARTDKTAAYDSMLEDGIEMIHRALDLASVESLERLDTVAPVSHHVTLHRDDHTTTLRRLVCGFPLLSPFANEQRLVRCFSKSLPRT